MCSFQASFDLRLLLPLLLLLLLLLFLSLCLCDPYCCYYYQSTTASLSFSFSLSQRMRRHQVHVMVVISGWPSGTCSPFALSVVLKSRQGCQGPTQTSLPLHRIWCFHIFLTLALCDPYCHLSAGQSRDRGRTRTDCCSQGPRVPTQQPVGSTPRTRGTSVHLSAHLSAHLPASLVDYYTPRHTHTHTHRHTHTH